MTALAPPATSTAMSHGAPLYATLGVAALGALIGGAFPISVIFGISDVAAGLSASADDAAWIITIYNVGQLVAQPVLMILVGAVGRGRAMRTAGAGYVLMSLAVALTPNLGFAIYARLFQGLFGGMLPTLMMLLVMTSPLQGRARVAGLATFALSASLGVGFGAGMAAWMVGFGGWRMLFWGQVAAGLIYLGLACLVLRQERGDLKRLRSADWASLFLVSLSVGLLAIGLGEGERRFWLESWWIAACFACAMLAGVFSLESLGLASNPLIRLEIFAKPTLVWALIMQLLFRFGLMVIIEVIPQYLIHTQGFRIEQLGPLLAPLALATMVTGPMAWWTACRFDPRITLSAGLACFALAAARCMFIAPDWAAPQLIGPVIVAGVGQALFGVAVLRFATWDINMAQGASVGVMFNFARVFGLIGGLAVAAHTIDEREKFHSAHLVERLNIIDPAVSARLATQAGPYANWLSDPQAAQRGGLADLARTAGLQAFTQGYADAFAVIAVTLLLAAALVWALPRLPVVPAREA